MKLKIQTEPQPGEWASSRGARFKFTARPTKRHELAALCVATGTTVSAFYATLASLADPSRDEAAVDTAAEVLRRLGVANVATLDARAPDGSPLVVDVNGAPAEASEATTRLVCEETEALAIEVGLVAFNAMSRLEEDIKNAEPAPA